VGPGDTLGQAGRQAMTRKWSMLCFICNVYISDFSSQNLHTIVSYNAKSNHWVWKQKYFLLNKKTLLCCSYKFWSREIGFWLLTYKYVGSLKHYIFVHAVRSRNKSFKWILRHEMVCPGLINFFIRINLCAKMIPRFTTVSIQKYIYVCIWKQN
jgi:hypothetical protein